MRFLLVCLLSISTVVAQVPYGPIKPTPSGEILSNLKKLNVLGTVLYVAAHPDDENTLLLTYLARERLVRTAYLSLTRGDGGQNLIGPEQGENIGVIRTQELLAARRVDGPDQFFSRAYDFGFSKSTDEAVQTWDRDKVLSDVVWVIRQYRPDVIITRFPPDARAGHGHHSASAFLAEEAFKIAGDPTRFPDQLRYVKPWQPKRIMWNAYNPGNFQSNKAPEETGNIIGIETGIYNPLLGRSYGEIAAESRSQHRSQGFGVSANRDTRTDYLLLKNGDRVQNDLFDGIDVSWGRVKSSGAVQMQVDQLISSFRPDQPEASVPALTNLYTSLSRLDTTNIYVRAKRQEVQALLQQTLGLYVETTPAEYAATPGESIQVKTNVISRAGKPLTLLDIRYSTGGPVPAKLTSDKRSEEATPDDAVIDKSGTDNTLSGKFRRVKSRSGKVVKRGSTSRKPTPGAVPDDDSTGTSATAASGLVLKDTTLNVLLKPNEVLQFATTLTIPQTAKISQPYWLEKPINKGTFQINKQTLIGLPENPPALTVSYTLEINKQRFTFTRPVVFKSTDPVEGEIYRPFVIQPAVTANLTERVFTFADEQPKTAEIVLRAGRARVAGTLQLTAPTGWSVSPESVPFDLKNKGDDQAVSFTITPAANATNGTLRAVMKTEMGTFTTGIKTIAYSHIPTQTLFPPAEAKLVKVDVAVTAKNVGYIVGAGDDVPAALRQMGCRVTFLGPAELGGDLSNYDAIVTGVRAYNTNDWLARYQPSLLEYVKNGGNLIVQYVTPPSSFLRSEPPLPPLGPYPFKVARDRITDEDATMTFIDPSHPLLNTPNKITQADFTGWIQERGIYFAQDWSKEYKPIFSAHDPNEPAKEGSLLYAEYGKGHFMYTGLVFFRELPAGVPGAYRLFANMISAGK